MAELYKCRSGYDFTSKVLGFDTYRSDEPLKERICTIAQILKIPLSFKLTTMNHNDVVPSELLYDLMKNMYIDVDRTL